MTVNINYIYFNHIESQCIPQTNAQILIFFTFYYLWYSSASPASPDSTTAQTERRLDFYLIRGKNLLPSNLSFSHIPLSFQTRIHKSFFQLWFSLLYALTEAFNSFIVVIGVLLAFLTSLLLLCEDSQL